MQQHMEATDADLHAIPGAEPQPSRVVLRTDHFDRQIGLAEAARRMDDAHPRRSRELQAEALLRTDERDFVDFALAQRRRGELRSDGSELDILGTHQQLDPLLSTIAMSGHATVRTRCGRL